MTPSDKEAGFLPHTRLDAIRYNYRSKDEADMPFIVNVFNSKKQGKTLITLEIEFNQACNLPFKQIEMLTIAVNMGDKPVDIELVKRDPKHVLD